MIYRIAAFAAMHGITASYVYQEIDAGNLPAFVDEWGHKAIDTDDSAVGRWLRNPNRGVQSKAKRRAKEGSKE